MSNALSLIAASVISYAATPPASLPDLEVRNASADYAVSELYLAPASGGDWSENILSGDEVLPGEVLTISDIPSGAYDVRLVDDSGASCTLTDIDFQRDPTFTFTGSDCLSR